MQALALLGSLVSLVCLILVLVKMYPIEGVGKTILGFICGLYAFIWGWQNQAKLGIKNIMMIWSAALVLIIIGNIAGSS
jgi:pilus assembly protein TadC